MCNARRGSRSSRSCGSSTSVGGSIRRWVIMVSRRGQRVTRSRPRTVGVVARDRGRRVRGGVECGAVERGREAGGREQRWRVGAAGTERGAGGAGAFGAERVEALDGGFAARYEARSLRMWWTPDKGMLHLHGQLPDVLGATFEATIQQLTDQRKPAKGQVWDSFEHRAADALVQLCEQPEVGAETPTMAPRPGLQVHVPEHGPAEIAGIPIADSRLEQLRANASIEPVLVDDDGTPIAMGNASVPCHPRSCGRCCSAIRAVGSVADATGSRSITYGPGPGAAATRFPTWRRCARPATTTSSHMATTPWSAIRTCPGVCARSTSTHLTPNNANRSASHHREQDRRRDLRGWRAGSPVSRCRAGSRAVRRRTGTPSGRRPRRRPRAVRSRRCRGWACPCTG